MSRLENHISKKIQSLSKSELEKIVLRFAARNEELYSFLMVNYIDQEGGEEDLFQRAKDDIQLLFTKQYRGFSEQLKLANMIDVCVKRINEFAKTCKKKNLEADLIMLVLDVVFASYADLFGTCFTRFDSRTGLLVKRQINMVNNKLHPDYKIEYQKSLNQYLKIMHEKSNHVNSVYELPNEI